MVFFVQKRQPERHVWRTKLSCKPAVSMANAPVQRRRESAVRCNRLGRSLANSALLAFVNPDLWIRHEVGLQLSNDIVPEQRALQVALCGGS